MTKRKTIEVPVIPDEYRYRKIYLAMMICFKSNLDFMVEKGGIEMAQEGFQRAASGFSKKLGQHIVRDFKIPSTLEGAMQLSEIYNRYIANSKLLKHYIEDDAGYVNINDCTFWEMLCKENNIRCNNSCIKHEGQSLFSNLDFEFNLEMIECKPDGDKNCIFKVTIK